MILLLACAGSESAVPDAPQDCGAVDYTGLLDIRGSWATTFGQSYFDSECDIEGFELSDQDWIGAFTVTGAAPNLLAGTFSASDETYDGAWDARGGVTFSGEHDTEYGMIYANFSGLVYADQYLADRTTIDGAAFLGVDADRDGRVDCVVRGSWDAKLSQ